jgi:acyl-CoA reductase-like NAD-dependent aldehyde dehydrogenase
LESVADQFERKLVERVKRIKVGNGLAEGVEMGPVVGEKEMNNLSHLLSPLPRNLSSLTAYHQL